MESMTNKEKAAHLAKIRLLSVRIRHDEAVMSLLERRRLALKIQNDFRSSEKEKLHEPLRAYRKALTEEKLSGEDGAAAKLSVLKKLIKEESGKYNKEQAKIEKTAKDYDSDKEFHEPRVPKSLSFPGDKLYVDPDKVKDMETGLDEESDSGSTETKKRKQKTSNKSAKKSRKEKADKQEAEEMVAGEEETEEESGEKETEEESGEKETEEESGEKESEEEA
jgi:hypothetical protein